MIDLSDVIGSLRTGTYTITRPAATGIDSLGRATSGGSSTFTVDAIVTPASGKDLLALPEALRTLDTVAALTIVQLLDGDLITVMGAQFEVKHAEPWNEAGAYWRCLAVRGT